MKLDLLVYGGAVSACSIPIVGDQLCRLYHVPLPSNVVGTTVALLPYQTLLKTAQVSMCLPMQEWVPAPMMFAAMGVLQGGVYGHTVIHLTKRWKLTTTTPSPTGMFRGAMFAASRDSVSQGLAFSTTIPIFDTILGKTPLSRKLDVACTAGVATLLSQGFHNAQSLMQSDSTIGYGDTLRKLWSTHGVRAFWMGVEARIVLVVLVNVLNDVFLYDRGV